MRTSQDIRKIIHSKIRYKRDDTLFSHIKTFIERDYNNYNGTLEDDEFAIWKSSGFAGVFYPVIYGKITKTENNPTIITTTKLNPFGFLISILIAGIFLLSLLYKDDHFDLSLSTYFISLICLSLLVLAFQLGYRHERKKTLADFKELINKSTD